MIKRSSWIVVMLLVFFTACKKNEYIIPREELVEILVDVHLAEGITQTNLRDFVGAEDRQKAIESIYEKHGVEQERFDSTMHYYALNPEEYSLLYEKVMEEVLLLESKIKAGEFDRSELFKTQQIISENFPQDSILMDSIKREIWWESRNYNLPEDGSKERGTFEKNYSDTANFKALLLLADIHLFYDDCSLNPKMELRVSYSNDSVDKASIKLKRDSLSYPYSIYLPVSDTTKLLSISGNLIDHDACVEDKHAIIKNIRMYEIVDTGHPKLILPERILSRE